MKTTSRNLIIVFVLAGLAFFGHSLSVGAAANNEGLNLTTSPVTVNLSSEPGKPVSTTLRVKNGENHAEKLKVQLLKFSARGENGEPSIDDRGPGDDYFDWVSFSQTQINADPGVWNEVKMTINPPKSAAFGYYYAVAFTRDTGDNVPNQPHTAFIGSTAVLVLYEAKVPNAKRALEVADYSASKKVYEFLPATFNIRVHNSGNVHAMPHGSIFITKGKKQLAVLDVNRGGGNILPNTYRVFSADWSDGFPVYAEKKDNKVTSLDKSGHQIRSLKWDFSQAAKFRFGKYTAHLTLVYDNGKRDEPIDAELSFWVIPWRLIGLILLVFVFTPIGVYATVNRLLRRMRRARDE